MFVRLGFSQVTAVMESLLFVVLITVIFEQSTSFPSNIDIEAKLFLQKEGFFQDSARNFSGDAVSVPDDVFHDALREFQRYVGLKQTGKLDEETLEIMRAPRCGVKDEVGPANSARKKRFAWQGSLWTKPRITYKISKYSTRLKGRKKTKKELVKAFRMWSEFIPIDFIEQKHGEADIDISFERGLHGEHDFFDELDDTIAHAFSPAFGGDVHFNDDQNWTLDKQKSGINLFQIAVHEFGHSLGLAHSDNIKSVMYRYPPRIYEPNFKLHSDDIKGIQNLYGKRNRKNRKRKPKQKAEANKDIMSSSDVSDTPNLCQDSSIDTVTRTKDGTTYFFKGEFYWKVLPKCIAKGYPRRISDDWDGLPGDLDASVTRSDGKTFFFKGTKFWRFTNKNMDAGYPKLLSSRFRGIPNGIDAAFESSDSDIIYFIKGPNIWRYDSEERHVSPQFPKPLQMWKGLPDRIDAAFRWKNGHTYFFKGDKYYRFSDDTFEVDAADLPYPRLTSMWWFCCQRDTVRNRI